MVGIVGLHSTRHKRPLQNGAGLGDEPARLVLLALPRSNMAVA